MDNLVPAGNEGAWMQHNMPAINIPGRPEMLQYQY